MAILNFPANPTNGDTYIENGIIYTWNSAYWDASDSDSFDNRYVEIDGDTMTGQLNLPGGGSATQALQKQEIESLVSSGGYWERSGGTLNPKVSSDNVNIGGSIQVSNLNAGAVDNSSGIKLNASGSIFAGRPGVDTAFAAYNTSSSGGSTGATIEIKTDGSITAAGVIYCGGNAFNGGANGSRLSSNGSIYASASNDGETLWGGYKTGSTNFTSRIDANGSITAAGDVQAGGRDPGATDTRGVRIAVDSKNGGVYTQAKGSAAASSYMAFQALHGTTEKFKVMYDGSITAAGTGIFGGKVQAGEALDSENFSYLNLGQIYVNRTNTGSPLFVGKLNGTTKVSISGDGSIEAAGTIDLGGFASSPEGSRLYEDGKLYLRNDASGAGNAGINIFKGAFNAANSVFRVDYDGSIAAAGDIKKTTAAGSLVALQSDTYWRLYDGPNSLENYKISLENDGSASFAGGKYEIKPNGTQLTYGTGLATSGVYHVKNDGVWKAVLTGGGRLTLGGSADQPGTSNIVLDGADGSATFGIGTPGSANAASTLINGLGGIETQAASGNVFIGRQGSNGAATSTINADGSASFAGDVQVGGNASTSSRDIGTYLWEAGAITIAAPSSQDIFNGYTAGSNVGTSTITADGSASFAGDVTAGDFFDDTKNGSLLSYTGAVMARQTNSNGVVWQGLLGNTQTSKITADGSATFGGDLSVQGSSYIRVRKTGDDTATAIQLSPDGTASFAGGITAGDTIGSINGNLRSYLNPGNIAIQSTTKDSTAAFTIEGGRGSDSAENVVVMTTDGSASFAGAGAIIDNNGQISVKRNDGNDSFSCFIGLNSAGTNTTSILGNGNAFFVGTVTAANTLFDLDTGGTLDVKDRLTKANAALLSLKAAAISATDFASLKSAIVTALADI